MANKISSKGESWKMNCLNAAGQNNEKLQMIVNNLATAVSYSFQNALALQE